ncbi:hypothetical protein EBL85_05170 [Marichromatium sp. AB32]|nr:hypothetical protein EBL85_05170 [Marichromatium sp. AB32]
MGWHACFTALACEPSLTDSCSFEKDVEDGIDFDSNAVCVDQIQEEVEYGGLRLYTSASINGTGIAVIVDVAFSEMLEPYADHHR